MKDRVGTRNLGFGHWKCRGEIWVYTLCHVEQGFSSFFAKFLTYLMMFQSGVACAENMPKIWQKMKKSLVQLAFIIHFSADSRYVPEKSDFGYPIHH